MSQGRLRLEMTESELNWPEFGDVDFADPLDLEYIERKIMSGANLNREYGDGETALLDVALLNVDTENTSETICAAAHLMLANGANPNFTGNYTETPLDLACTSPRHEALIVILLAHGARHGSGPHVRH